MRFFSVANPENRRARLFQAALESLGCPSATIVPYAELLSGDWSRLDGLRDGDVVRIESPGENAEVERGLVLRGAAVRQADPVACRREFPLEHGRIYQPDWWFAGFRDLLEAIERRCQASGAGWMNAPAGIAEMFDKTRCHQRLDREGLPVAEWLGPVDSYEELRRRMRERSVSRVFVKLRSGSSASGVVALRAGTARVSATTSVEMVRHGKELRLFNSLRVRRYTRERDVEELIDALCTYGVHVEHWIPKAGWRGATFDLRIVVVGGEPRHTVMRCSQGPLTNLHLGNRRGDVEQLLADVDRVVWHDAHESCRRVAKLFPESLYFGVDLMFTPGLRRHFLLEVNAFGDLLPGVLCGGEDTYTAEVRACLPTRAHAGSAALTTSGA